MAQRKIDELKDDVAEYCHHLEDCESENKCLHQELNKYKSATTHSSGGGAPRGRDPSRS